MKKVLTCGVFDLLHIGHLNALEFAASQGDYLIAAVHDDKYKSKGVSFHYSLKDRLRIVNSLKCVDEAIVYERVDLLVNKIDFDVFAFGEDQNHQYFQKAIIWCNQQGKKVVKIPRTEGISSTILRKGVA